jgi:hypothetical protein
MLTDADLERFVEDGFVRVEGAFSRATAEQGRAVLWRETGCDPEDPTTWTRPVIRLGLYGDPPFVEAVNSAVLHEAFDQLVGQRRWLPRASLGTFPVRFPSPEDPGDAGWHVDASFDTESPDFLSWRVNVASKGRALLMLFLFSDVGPDDAPTRIGVGSHLHIARILAPAGDRGLSLRELVASGAFETVGGREVLATGDAGTVYLCHPFLVHAAQPHRGTRPRFMAQPPLLPAGAVPSSRPAVACSPVEQAIRRALGQ